MTICPEEQFLKRNGQGFPSFLCGKALLFICFPIDLPMLEPLGELYQCQRKLETQKQLLSLNQIWVYCV